MTASTDSQEAATRRPDVASVPGRSGMRLVNGVWAGSVVIAIGRGRPDRSHLG